MYKILFISQRYKYVGGAILWHYVRQI